MVVQFIQKRGEASRYRRSHLQPIIGQTEIVIPRPLILCPRWPFGPLTRLYRNPSPHRPAAEAGFPGGWEMVKVYEDAGISGAKGRDKRPAYDALLRAVTRREVDLVAAWSVDRLGRSMQDLVAFLEDLRGHGADLYLHQQPLDTTTPSGHALFGMMAVFAEFERAMIQERVNAGLARAKAEGKKLGRPTIGSEVEAKVRELRTSGMGIVKVAKALGIGVSAVQRVAAPTASS